MIGGILNRSDFGNWEEDNILFGFESEPRDVLMSSSNSLMTTYPSSPQRADELHELSLFPELLSVSPAVFTLLFPSDHSVLNVPAPVLSESGNESTAAQSTTKKAESSGEKQSKPKASSRTKRHRTK